jgi:hypothetical protein
VSLPKSSFQRSGFAERHQDCEKLHLDATMSRRTERPIPTCSRAPQPLVKFARKAIPMQRHAVRMAAPLQSGGWPQSVSANVVFGPKRDPPPQYYEWQDRSSFRTSEPGADSGSNSPTTDI